MQQVRFNVELQIAVKKKANVYVSYCPVLDIYSQGTTLKEAERNISEAIKLFIDTCFEMGTLDAVLKACGFKATSKPSKISKPKAHKSVTVPLFFKVKGPTTSCHV